MDISQMWSAQRDTSGGRYLIDSLHAEGVQGRRFLAPFQGALLNKNGTRGYARFTRLTPGYLLSTPPGCLLPSKTNGRLIAPSSH
jgi:hypothetical protein